MTGSTPAVTPQPPVVAPSTPPPVVTPPTPPGTVTPTVPSVAPPPPSSPPPAQTSNPPPTGTPSTSEPPTTSDDEGSSGSPPATSVDGESSAAPSDTSAPEPQETCQLTTPLRWTSSQPLAQPMGNGWNSLKDFSVTKYNGKYLVYATVQNGNWNGFFSTFDSFDQWAGAEQHFHEGHVAPQIFYFEPKDTWILVTQWPIRYRTSKTPDNFSSWSNLQSLMNGDPTNGRGVGPIDPAVICDDTDCYLFFNDDAGGVYRGSMPIAQFPSAFSNVTRIMDDASIIFEGIQVYSLKGSDKYLMIIENNGTRAFRAWTADDLGGNWTPLQGANTTQQPFAGEENVTWPGGKWTRDISHGDIVRENPSEKMEVDPCNLQMLYQGRDPNIQTAYESLPYRPGLLTLER